MTFDRLVAKIRDCDICREELPYGPRPVFRAHPAARILIAGQAPGRKVHETGIPFNDPSGVRLREWLGVSPEDFYDPEQFAIIPMGFCYPGTGKGGDSPPRPECAATWRAKLLNELPNIRLTLALGRYAHDWHLGQNSARPSLADTVKDWRKHLKRGLAPMPHPSPRNIRWFKANPWFEAEMVPAIRARVHRLLAE
jgi:uracil-DNA glycosylase